MLLATTAGLMIEIILYSSLLLVTILLVSFTSYKNSEFNSKLLGFIAILISIVYLIDVITPVFTGNINFNKITFTIGTVMCPLIIITRYIKPFDRIKPTVALIAVVSIFTYSLYYVRPESFNNLTAEKIFQIYVYYSLLFIYGVLSITTKDVTLEVKKCYKELIALGVIELFSLTIRGIIAPPARSARGVFSILESSPMVILISFSGILLIYLIEYLIRKIKVRLKK